MIRLKPLMSGQRSTVKIIYLIIVLGSFIQNGNGFCSRCVSTNTCEDFGPVLNWVIEPKMMSPDNFLQRGKVINGKFPGPTVEVSPNSHLVIKVTNKSGVNTTMHWHGLHQERTVDADGVAHVTQDPITPGSTYTYCIWIGHQPGTYMYHGHVDMDLIWIHGVLIVKDVHLPVVWNPYSDRNDYHYDEERTLLFTELFHVPLSVYMDNVLNGVGTRPTSVSYLINGKSYGEWGANNGNSSGYEVIRVKKGGIYRFRIINLTSDKFIQFFIEGHKMRVIEMDGIFTEPVDVDFLQIHTGQRYSILVTMDQSVGNYLMDMRTVGGAGPRNGVAILHYKGAVDPTPLRKIVRAGRSEAIPVTKWVTDRLYPPKILRGIQPYFYPIPSKIDRNIVIDFRLQIGQVARFILNGHIYEHPKETYLFQTRSGINITDAPQVMEIISGESVQVIFQNRMGGSATNIFCIPHPWHLHGRFFHVVTQGPDEFNAKRDLPIINEKARNPHGKFQFRDVFVIYPEQSVEDKTLGAGCGWAAVRFHAFNPGLWLNHCHMTSHMIEGKQFVFYEHTSRNPRLFGE